MPNMPHGDRIRELEMTVASQSSRLEAINKALESLGQSHQETVHRLNELRRESERKIAILEEKISKLEGAQSNVADRLWSVIPPVLAAMIAALLTWLFTRGHR